MGLDEIYKDEIWKPVLNYEDRYLISNYGRVKSLKINAIMSPQPTKGGYQRVRLFGDDGRYHSKMIHNLVAEAFLEKHAKTNDKWEIDHIDCNPANNKVDNLRWLTRKENLKRSFDLGHQSKPLSPVIQYDLNGNEVARYTGVNEAFRQTNIRHISDCASGKQKTAGGYIWKYNLERSVDL